MDRWMDGWIDVCVCYSALWGCILTSSNLYFTFLFETKNTLYPGWWEQPWDIWVDQNIVHLSQHCSQQLLSWHLDLQFPELAEEIPGIINALFKSLCWLENDGNQWFSVIWGALPRKLSRGQCLRDRVSLQVSAFVTSFQYWPKENWDACSLKRGDMIVISGWLCQSVCHKD